MALVDSNSFDEFFQLKQAKFTENPKKERKIKDADNSKENIDYTITKIVGF
jgi:hypothetical protein